MFNQELKQRFIKEYSASISVREACAASFNAFEKYEVEWGDDLCTKSAEELQPIVNEIIGIRARSKLFRVTFLRDYVTWCIKNNIPGACDGMLRVDTLGVDKMRSHTVTSPLHLQIYLNQICEPEAEETTDNIYRCFYWLAYSGVPESDILQVKTTDVDLLNMVVNVNGYEYPIYREAIPAFKNCMYLTRFVFKHPNYSADKTMYRQRADGKTLVRGIRSTPSITAMRVELSRRSKRCVAEGKTELQLSYFRVWISGMFYRAYQREIAGMPVDFMAEAARFMEGKTYKLDKGRNTPASYQRKVAGDYLKDYESWKMTFKI